MVITAAELPKKAIRRCPRASSSSTAQRAPPDVVLDHAVRGHPARRSVDEHQRGARLPSPQIGLVGRDRRDHQARDAPPQQGFHGALLVGRVRAQARHQYRRRSGPGHLGDRLDDRPEERIGEVGDRNADRAVPPGAEGLGQHVRHVAEFIDRPLHPRPHLGGHIAVAVDHPRYRLAADPGQRGDLTHRAHRVPFGRSMPPADADSNPTITHGGVSFCHR